MVLVLNCQPISDTSYKHHSSSWLDSKLIFSKLHKAAFKNLYSIIRVQPEHMKMAHRLIKSNHGHMKWFPSSHHSDLIRRINGCPSAPVTCRNRDLARTRKYSTESAAFFNKYCVDQVKLHDHNNYLAGLLLPKKYQDAFFAIRAFNIEIATIKDNVRGNVTAGRIRFQWWEETLDTIYSVNNLKQSFQHPVADAIGYHAKQWNLSQIWFLRTLHARKQDMGVSELDSLDELEVYAENGHSPLLYLQLELFNIDKQNAKYLASHIGVGSGIATMLRGIPHNVQQNQQYIPREIMEKFHVTLNMALGKIAGPADVQKLSDAVYDVACQSYGHIDKARDIYQLECHALPNLKYVLFPGISSLVYLDNLRKCNFNPYAPELENRPLSTLDYQMRLLKLKMFGSF